jgi:hypothetical protein
VLELVGLVADNVGVGKAARVMGLNSKTVGLFMSRLGSACIRSVERPRAWSRLQVDETFVGKHKHSRSNKSRARSWWFITCTRCHGVAVASCERYTCCCSSLLSSSPTISPIL